MLLLVTVKNIFMIPKIFVEQWSAYGGWQRCSPVIRQHCSWLLRILGTDASTSLETVSCTQSPQFQVDVLLSAGANFLFFIGAEQCSWPHSFKGKFSTLKMVVLVVNMFIKYVFDSGFWMDSESLCLFPRSLLSK